MTSVPTLDLQQKPLTSQQQLQRLMMLPGMQQAIHLLQMNAMELAPLVETHLSQNPVIEIDQDEQNEDIERLENENAEEEEDIEDTPDKEMDFNDHDFDIIKRLDQDFRDNWIEESPYRPKKTSEEDQQQSYNEQSISVKPTLYEFLIAQAHDSFDNPKDFGIAEILLGYFDESGYQNTPLKEIADLHEIDEKKLNEALEIIQTFEPYGVGAKNLQESLLIQLRCQEKQNSLASKIVEKHFDDLLHNRIPLIEKSLRCPKEKISQALQDISKLDLHPGTSYSLQDAQPIIPDVTLKQDGEELLVGVNDDFLPPMRINNRYLKLMREDNLTVETKQFIQQHIASAKWLLRNLQQRNNTLQRIVQVLAKRQRNFFLNPDGKLVPTTMKMISEEIEMHESTVARAVANKYVDSPRGLLPLRSFFSNAYTTDEGVEISSNTVRDLLQEFISKEDKYHPLSDATLATNLKARGIVCARRTVAKYRSELNLGTAQQRRQFT